VRYDVYLTDGDKSYFSQSYKHKYAAVALKERLDKKYGRLGFGTRIDVTEKEKPKRKKRSVFESCQE